MKDLSVGELGDVTSLAVILGVFSDLLPPIAALLAIFWSGIRIYEWARVRLFGLQKDLDLK